MVDSQAQDLGSVPSNRHRKQGDLGRTPHDRWEERFDWLPVSFLVIGVANL